MSHNDEQGTRPLLNEAEAGLKTGDNCRDLSFKPSSLPAVQLGILCFLRTLDPMSFTQIFPYINELIGDLHVTNDPTQIGFYSGLVESSFAFTQLLSIYPWGFSSDRFGRRPVVLAGVGGLAITTLLFGLSTSFPTALLARAAGIFHSASLLVGALLNPEHDINLAGLFAGNVTVIPSMLCELTNETNQASAFSFFGLWWPLGAIVGKFNDFHRSLVGGLLSKPAIRYMNYFDHAFFKNYPYFLPCFVVSTLATIGFIISWFFLKECRYFVRYAHLVAPLASSAFDVLFVLFCFSPVSAGGLSFSTSQIGFALSAAGGIAALLQVVFMPTILNRVSHTNMYHFCMKIWPYSFVSLPFLNVIARQGVVEGTEELNSFTIVVLWVSIAIVLAMARVAFLAYTVNVLLVKRFTPNSSSLGTTLSLVQFCICFSRAFSPAFASSAFAFSIQYHIFGGYFWVVLMASIGFTSCLFSRKIVTESSKLSM
ncbi:LOW QUALITY PROTEIN: hypothetical protein CVT25_011797 [Psilocybe cyanescens]|uniref:Major facilitator superfamily (MFS) profile domain-containing protein n=1 Tax=Psilocybe cyanescens TaxID=93625 RepID=A0A409WJ51_PSICY|nr:LOW QUALITY PROTEIN: hypothetical protein CVT25_011797 [Psilocybe cyanescens]